MAFLGVYGHVNLDVLLVLERIPKPHETVPTVGRIERLGGTGGTIARAAATLGVPTALAAFVGEDFPAEHRATLEGLGVDLTDLRTRPGPTPRCWILSVPGGASSTVIDQGVYRGQDDAPLLDFTLMNSDWVHLTTGDPRMHLEVGQQARRLGKRVAFDPAQELSYRYDGRSFEKLLNASHVLWVNEVELGRALELMGYGDPVQLFDHVETIVVTKGDQGAELRTEQETLPLPAERLRGNPRPETTGAGDVLRGGFYAGLHAGRSVAQALRWGSVATALYLESGVGRLPTRAELAARLAEKTD